MCTTAHPPTTIATPMTIAVNIAGVESKCKNVYNMIPVKDGCNKDSYWQKMNISKIGKPPVMIVLSNVIGVKFLF